MSGIVLSSAVRTNLTTLQSTSALQGKIQEKLSTGQEGQLGHRQPVELLHRFEPEPPRQRPLVAARQHAAGRQDPGSRRQRDEVDHQERRGHAGQHSAGASGQVVQGRILLDRCVCHRQPAASRAALGRLPCQRSADAGHAGRVHADSTTSPRRRSRTAPTPSPSTSRSTTAPPRLSPSTRPQSPTPATATTSLASAVTGSRQILTDRRRHAASPRRSSAASSR